MCSVNGFIMSRKLVEMQKRWKIINNRFYGFAGILYYFAEIYLSRFELCRVKMGRISGSIKFEF